MLRKRTNIIISTVLIILLGFMVYSNSLNGEFLWDDNVLVRDNTYIRDWSNLPRMFTPDAGAKFGVGIGKKYNFFRPSQMITYMMDYSLWKLDVRGYHLSNVVFHVFAALAVFWLAILFYDNWLMALLAGLLFVAHPARTEVVSYISGRADSLTALFLPLCFIFYIKYLRAERFSFLLLACASYILSLLSRENSLILPLLLILYHYSFKVRFKFKQFLPIASLSLIYIVLRCTLLKSLLSETFPTTFIQRVPGFFVALLNYTRLLMAPFNLHMEYGNGTFAFNDQRAIAGAVILFFVLAYVFSVRKKEGYGIIFFSVLWFVLALLPSSNLYPLNAYMAEHWLYIPSIGIFLIAAKGFILLYERRPFQVLSIVLAALPIGFYSILTFKQNAYWRDSISLYRLTLKHSADSARVHFNLGNQYHNQGKTTEAS